MESIESNIKDTKMELEQTNQICRCCLSTNKKMYNACDYEEYFVDLAGINVSVSDGLPQWICYECCALLMKSVRFKYKMLRAQIVLNEYLSRCAPFPIDGEDPELSKYASPNLISSKILSFDLGRSKNGFQVLQHEKLQSSSQLDEIQLYQPVSKTEDVQTDSVMKIEPDYSDYEDDLSLMELRDNKSISMIETNDIENDTAVKKKKRKETKLKKSKIKKKQAEESSDCEIKKKSSIRKPIELDPEKIRIITLNPEEQIRQREEESKAGLKFIYQCKLCYKGFNFESKLQNHMTKHSPSRGKYKCNTCTMYLPTPYSYQVHSLIHTRRYECVKCGRRMIDRPSIYNHYRTQHEGITTFITCDICGKVSSNQKTHRSHVRNHHSGERPKCDQCGKTFVNKDSLTEHMQIHSGIKNYECPLCGKRCRSRTHMKTHMIKHTDVKEYYCVECDVRFKTAYNLRQHLAHSLKHRDERNFKFSCSICPRRFDTAARLRAHTAAHGSGPRSHACATCGAGLATRASLMKHVRHVHGGQRPPPTHVCHTCGKAFRGKSVLINHIRTHTGEKPFSCSVCGRCFTQRTALLTHHRLVHLKIKRNYKSKPTSAQVLNSQTREVKPETVDKVPQVGYDWTRPCEVFYVTAGP